MRALVTGASRGIGEATARRLVRDGWDVALHAHRHLAHVEALAERFQALGREAWVVPGDLAQPAVPHAIVKRVQARWESLDAVVLNAGVYDRQAFPATTDDDVDRTLRVNFTSAFALARGLLPLLARAESGRIVFLSSVLAFSGSRHGAAYAASKAALVGLSRSLALELAPAITVNVVAPGSIDTAILAGDTAAQRAQRIRGIPLARIGSADDVAAAIAFLTSRDASYITGSTLHVNGGLRSDG